MFIIDKYLFTIGILFFFDKFVIYNNANRKKMSINNIKSNFEEIQKKKSEIALDCGREPNDIKIIAVSKTHSAEIVKQAIDAGVSIFGENYVQELIEKQHYFEGSELKPQWHFIGHLQSNKVKYIAPYITMIHSVDSVKLANEISKRAEQNNRTIDILLQVNTSQEDSKSGAAPEDALKIAESIVKIPFINLKGAMTIGSFSDDEKIIKREFRLLVSIFNEIKEKVSPTISEISMGMSHDYDIAIREGATMVRIGTAIFGSRSYSD